MTVTTAPVGPRGSALPRLQWLELEDQPWFPAVVRDLATDYLRFIETRLDLDRPLVPVLAEVLRQTKILAMVDLCAGGGGPVPALQKALADEGLRVEFVLTDLFPNADAFSSVSAAADPPGSIRGVLEPIDARHVPRDLAGCRSLFNAFHHFNPTDARAILRDAANDRQPLVIFEISDRRPFNLLSILLLTPLVSAISALFIRPFTWRRLFWNWVVPAVPFTCVWDGVVSQLRAYTVDELEAMAREVQVEGYAWRAGHLPAGPRPGRWTYLIGVPS